MNLFRAEGRGRPRVAASSSRRDAVYRATDLQPFSGSRRCKAAAHGGGRPRPVLVARDRVSPDRSALAGLWASLNTGNRS